MEYYLIMNYHVEGETFVTRKITIALAKMLAGKQDYLYLGNLDAKRDWGFAGDYVEAMYLMLQQNKPEGYVMATGKTYTVQTFLQEEFTYKGLNWQDYVKIDKKYFRPTEVDLLIGDSTKDQKELNWKPTTNFKSLVKMMVDSDCSLYEVK
ncbi:MAG: GDPmannose 4,6-dehydratase [Candidatus Deianiraeaceae bacterium]|jgi:GDPmannose 4,6-dehydratase